MNHILVQSFYLDSIADLNFLKLFHVVKTILRIVLIVEVESIMKYYLESVDTVFKDVGSSESGLTSSQANERQEKNGKNKLKEGKKVSIF